MITQKNSFGGWKVIAVLCCMANSLSAGQSGKFKYTDNGTSITITGYSSDQAGTVRIPAAIVGKPVTSIGESAFKSCHGLTDVTIPAGVTRIGNATFYHCTHLKHVTIPAGVNSIGIVAFCGCIELEAVTIPNSVTRIGSYAFSECHRLNSVIPPGVTRIEDSTFNWCCALRSVTIPDGVTRIGHCAFYNCRLLSVTLPKSVTSFGTSAFPEGTIPSHRYQYQDQLESLQWKGELNGEAVEITITEDGKAHRFHVLGRS
ncbi:MAG: leucine-rich repeat domain-containing protein [Verrucomicrobiota bacterium]